jgi:hypothetical protein
MQYPWNPQRFFLHYPNDIASTRLSQQNEHVICNREVGALIGVQPTGA